ncbi:caspase family protein [Pseudoduganella lutea]|uniref:Peptidase C14 n=1 Tax=Pseudoduganella lutea TaxID=321985 RepID=A0A4P6KY10_9BURK|nr:caspase family protein [Pseudoduganella lutea]QBE63635.1 peptidase C14 [Pseudoduganella lutea]
MPAPFKQITKEQFAELLSKFPFKRKINAVHMHHTWKPDRAAYRKHDTIVAMWRFHTQTNGWSDIAQHISIAPDGTIWLGRDWNRPPASAAGHNGNAQAGPFMFEIIGNFDEGKDPFDGPQRDTVLEVIARVQHLFGLPPGSLQFHNMMSTKSCPGTSIDYHRLLHDVGELHLQLFSSTRAVPPSEGPFSPEQLASAQVVREAIEDLQRDTGRAIEPADAEPCARHEEQYESGAGRGGEGERGIRFDAADLQEMKPHIVNLRMGLFSSNGDWTTTQADVDAIFETYLPAALTAAAAEGRRLKLMFYAHGGLTSETSALAAARERIGWWKSNGIYPIHFIWETGLGEVLGQMLERWKQGRAPAARNVFSDHVSDPLIEAFAHRAGGVQIWNGMKWSAQQASSPTAAGATPGGAFYVAERLAAFCKNHEDIEVHAAGHSAGAIFHAYFIPCALERGVPKFHSLHLLAPASRVDLFHQKLRPVVEDKRIGQLTMYTMADSFEKDDDCGKVYRKSLLYLIHKGLEPDQDTPILGLEQCVRTDQELKKLFILGTGKARADVVWSDNRLDRGRSASRSRTHGGFDDDPATMGSIVRRVLDKSDADRIVELPAGTRGADLWQPSFDYWGGEQAEAQSQLQQPVHVAAAPVSSYQGWHAPAHAGTNGQANGGRRNALCVGIDTYPTAPLNACVNDARAWSDILVRLGFAPPRMLLDQRATRAAILQHLTQLVEDSRRGDVIVFQYAGHGTQVPDLDGDEQGGDTPGQDEALCPYDFASGELLVDDDMRAVFARLPDGVNLTCFFDCCHSGTITRFGVGGRQAQPEPGKRARFVPATRQLRELYRAKRQERGHRAAAGGGLDMMREVVFSACLSSEVALESGDHGDFTRCAMQVLAQDVAGLSNAEFAERVTQNFGHAPRQHAKLYSSEAGQGLGLLQPHAPGRGRSAGHAMGGPSAHEMELAALLARVRELLTPAH